MNILFAGSPEFAVPSFERVAQTFSVVGALTAPDAMKGRKKALSPTPIASAAEARGIRVFKPDRLGRAAREEISAVNADLLVCVAYGRIFGPKFLGLFDHGGINLHPSLLPRHRGPAPIPATILAGDKYAGITIQKLALEMDAGDVLIQEQRLLLGTETTGDLVNWAAERGAELLVEALSRIKDGSAESVPQNHNEATYCGLIDSEDARIDWNESAEVIQRKVRAYNPWPKAFAYLEETRIAILEAVVHSGADVKEAAPAGSIVGVDSSDGILVQTGVGVLGVRTLKPQTRRTMSWRDFVNGAGVLQGRQFRSVPPGTRQSAKAR